jgi:hypothetical protein
MSHFDDDDDGSNEDRNVLAARTAEDDQDFKELIAAASDAGISLDDLVGSQTQNTKENLTVPLLLTIEDEKKRLSYRCGDGMAQLFGGATPAGAAWVETDARMSLKKALRLYGPNLLAFEKFHRVTTLGVTGFTVRKRVEITIRVLVRKSA